MLCIPLISSHFFNLEIAFHSSRVPKFESSFIGGNACGIADGACVAWAACVACVPLVAARGGD